MKYNPDIHHRRSIRLKNYDYSSNGMYYVTLCTQDNAPLFGEAVGAAPCGRPATCVPNNASQMITKWLKKTEDKFPNTRIDKFVVMPKHIHFILCIQNGRAGRSGHAGPPLHTVVEWFKTMTTNEYIRGVKSDLFPPFNKRIWQRNYYERIIRGEIDYQHVWQYINENPAKWAEDEYFSN